MSILIKDMLMPKDCIFCPMAHWNKLDEITGCEIVIGKKFVDKTDRDFWYGDGRPKWCPLKELPSAEQWIPCSERLPEVGEDVFISVGERVCEAHLRASGDYFLTHKIKELVRVRSVDAWRPLPKSYEGEQNDNLHDDNTRQV